MKISLNLFILGGPYAAFGGRDASRGLATFSVTTNANLEYDDLSDLNSMEMESIREWEMQFKGLINFFVKHALFILNPLFFRKV